MRRHCFSLLVLFGIVSILVGPVEASTVFKKPFQKRYGFRSVSCYTCHAKGKDKDGKPLGKEVLNDFGKEMKKVFVENKFASRLEEVKKADAETKKKVHAEIVKEFLEGIEEFEKMKSPSGEQWETLIKAGKIEGVKMRK